MAALRKRGSESPRKVVVIGERQAAPQALTLLSIYRLTSREQNQSHKVMDK